MGILTRLLGGGVSEAVKGVADTVDRFVETKDEKTAAELKNRLLDLERAKLADRGDERQVEVNRAEAQHSSVFVAGWRPSIGWLCTAALAYAYLLYPMLLWGLAVSGSTVEPPPLSSLQIPVGFHAPDSPRNLRQGVDTRMLRAGTSSHLSLIHI